MTVALRGICGRLGQRLSPLYVRPQPVSRLREERGGRGAGARGSRGSRARGGTRAASRGGEPEPRDRGARHLHRAVETRAAYPLLGYAAPRAVRRALQVRPVTVVKQALLFSFDSGLDRRGRPEMWRFAGGKRRVFDSRIRPPITNLRVAQIRSVDRKEAPGTNE